MELELFKIFSKYPFIVEGEFYDSTELKQNNTCVKKCDQKDCIKFLDKKVTLTHYICDKGYDTFLVILGNLKIIVNGIICSDNLRIAKERKSARKDWIVFRRDVDLFCIKIQEIGKKLQTDTNETIIQNFGMFHDFKTSMNIIFNCTQNIINELPGETFENKLNNSGRNHHDLYHALDLISSQLQMLDVVLNPQSISFGNKHEINLYKLFDKIRLLFEHVASKKNDVTIKLINVDGRYIRNSLCFDSIEFLPLILIDNALKYSSPGSKIEITLEQLYGKVKVKVKNIGPFVNDKNKEKIFEKFFRDESAILFSKEGIGLGLWVAQEILKTHNSKMFYNKDKNALGHIGLNIFEFELDTV